MSLSFFSSSRSSKSSAVTADRDGAISCKRDEHCTEFTQMIKASSHGSVFNMKGLTFDVYIDLSRLHWMLYLRMSEVDAEVGYFTLEIATPDLDKIEKVMFQYSSLKNAKYCGTIKRYTLRSIIEVADRLADEMGSYSLFCSNCQHFCNNFLNHFDFEVYRTTLGKDVTATIEKCVPINEEERHGLFQILKEARSHEADVSSESNEDPFCYNPGCQLNRTEIVIRVTLARILNVYVGAV